MPASAEEGTAWGAALMAKYRAATMDGGKESWSKFLASHSGKDQRVDPDPKNVQVYETVYARYKRLVVAQTHLDEAVASTKA